LARRVHRHLRAQLDGVVLVEAAREVLVEHLPPDAGCEVAHVHAETTALVDERRVVAEDHLQRV